MEREQGGNFPLMNYLHTLLDLIAHQFAKLGSSFLTIYTPPSSAITRKHVEVLVIDSTYNKIVFVFHCSTSAGRHFQMHPFQSPLHFCQAKIHNHLNELLRGYKKCTLNLRLTEYVNTKWEEMICDWRAV